MGVSGPCRLVGVVVKVSVAFGRAILRKRPTYSVHHEPERQTSDPLIRAANKHVIYIYT